MKQLLADLRLLAQGIPNSRVDVACFIRVKAALGLKEAWVIGDPGEPIHDPTPTMLIAFEAYQQIMAMSARRHLFGLDAWSIARLGEANDERCRQLAMLDDTAPLIHAMQIAMVEIRALLPK